MGTFRFRASGVVRDQDSGRPLASLLVRAYDKDLVFDDYLGSDTTDSNGRFEIQFTALDFQDWTEQRPDLYLRIFDSSGKIELCSTKRTVRRNARSEETFDIAIPTAKMRSIGISTNA